MTYDENRKYFIDNASTLINKSILNYYEDKLKNVHINYDIKETLHRLYMCLSSLYKEELGDMNIQDLMYDILDKTHFKLELNADTFISYQMMFINKLFNDYLDKKFNICKTFGLKSLGTIVHEGKYCYGPVFFELKNKGICGYHGSALNEDTYELSVMLIVNSIRNDTISNINFKTKDTYSYLKETDIDTIKKEKEILEEFEINAEILKGQLSKFICDINNEYCLGLVLSNL